MADLQKSTIVIASVLKPVDDSRMYEKIAISLAAEETYDVHVIGCASGGLTDPKIILHPFRPFGRISLRRILAPFVIFFTAMKLRPAVFIATTHELLLSAVFLKMFRRCRIVYDVQENYYWNILYTASFPQVIKPFIALYVRTKESLTAKYVDHFFLAESGYALELKFPGERKTVLENKVRLHAAQKKAAFLPSLKKNINLLFSGTLAQTTGVFTAIDVAVKLHTLDDRIRLTIIGSCAQPHILEKLRMLVHPRPFIELNAQTRPVPHQQIVEAIYRADFGLISYEINPSTMNSIPTKLYEYLGFKLPILLVNHRSWVDFCQRWSAAVVFDASHPDAAAVQSEMLTKAFYTSEPVDVYWESEEPKLLQVLRRVITH